MDEASSAHPMDEASSADDRTTVALWTRWDEVGLDHVRLQIGPTSIQGVGVVLGLFEAGPLRVDYRVECDAQGATRSVRIAVAGERDGSLQLCADGNGNWTDASGRAIPDLSGCLDVDISVTPFTNTLAIRRLRLAVGESAELAVAYVPVPDLAPRPVTQRYSRLAARRYRYDALFRDFVAELDIDDDGLVLDYPDTFRRVR